MILLALQHKTPLLLHPLIGLFSRTTWVSRYQKGKTSLDLNEARDDGVFGWQWHETDCMQREDKLGKSEEKRISEEAYDINKQTINMVPKSKIEPRAHYTLKPTHYI